MIVVMIRIEEYLLSLNQTVDFKLCTYLLYVNLKNNLIKQ